MTSGLAVSPTGRNVWSFVTYDGAGAYCISGNFHVHGRGPKHWAMRLQRLSRQKKSMVKLYVWPAMFRRSQCIYLEGRCINDSCWYGTQFQGILLLLSKGNIWQAFRENKWVGKEKTRHRWYTVHALYPCLSLKVEYSDFDLFRRFYMLKMILLPPWILRLVY